MRYDSTNTATANDDTTTSDTSAATAAAAIVDAASIVISTHYHATAFNSANIKTKKPFVFYINNIEYNVDDRPIYGKITLGTDERHDPFFFFP